MNHHKHWILALALAFCISARADVTAEKRIEIDKMLQLTGMEKVITQMKAQMLGGLKTSLPAAPAGFWEKFSEKMNTRDLIEQIVPIYDRYYTVEDLRAVNAFYSSAAGQKILSTLPQVMHDSIAVGQAWGQKIARQAADEVAAENKDAPK
jgi:uncharacterized protein